MAESRKLDSAESLLNEVEYRRLLQFGKQLVDANDQVQSMPTSTERQHAFDDSTTDTDFTLSDPDTSIRADTIIDGRYQLVRPIADGGMGTVWLARQSQPVKRDLAIKLIKPGLDSHQVLARFDAERQSLAMMNHTNIARIIDAGTTDGRQPFFAMELVEGLPFTKYCDKNFLSVNQRLQLFCDVCAGVQHAHQKGIIHRDLKPSNILVAEIDGEPVPKVIDFGLAKALENAQDLTAHSLQTVQGQVLGTLKYMSPEQASLDLNDVDTRTDIYSLGVVLYELLTGSTPLDDELGQGQPMLKLLQQIREKEPVRPSIQLDSDQTGLSKITELRRTDASSLRRVLSGDLDWIVMKALDKDRARRYETSSEFAADVRRFLANEPVQARPPSASYRLRKFARKNRAGVIAAGLLTAAMIAGTAGTSWGWRKALDSEQQANLQFIDAERARQQESLAKDKAELRLAQLEKSNGILEGVFEDLDVSGLKNNDESLESILGKRLANAARQLKQESVGDPLRVAEMQSRLGNSLISLGHLTEAIEVLEDACAVILTNPDADEILKQNCLNTLAAAYHKTDADENAIPLLEQALEICNRRLGPDAPDTLIVHGNLSSAYFSVGEIDKALELGEDNLQRLKSRFGPDDPQTLQSAGGLAAQYLKTGRAEKAVPMMEHVLESLQVQAGPSHPATLASMNNLAAAYKSVGRIDDALSLMKNAFELTESNRGIDHPDTLTAMNNLAVAYALAGQLDLSVPLMEEVLFRKEEQHGRDHRNTQQAVADLGIQYVKAERYAEAIPLLEEAFQSFPRSTRFAGIINLNLRKAYIEEGQVENLMELIEALLVESRTTFPAESLELARILITLGIELVEVEEFVQAEGLLRECLAIRGKKSPEVWSTFNAQAILGAALMGQEKFDDAEPLLIAGYEGMKHREETIPKEGKKNLEIARTARHPAL